VSAAVGIAKKLKIPSVIIGLTIVAMGTGAPEAVIGITASVRESGELAIGNVIGSNIFNLMFIMGLCAVIKPIKFDVKQISKDFWLSIAAAVFLIALMFISGVYIPRWGSLLLLVIFVVYLFFLILKATKAQKKESAEESEADKVKSWPVLIVTAMLGCGSIIWGGQLTVENATLIAIGLGVTERIIGLTIVAAGTSLPELVTSLVAYKKGENEFALANIIGSNIFNILFILGVAGLINPLPFDNALIFDTVLLSAGSLLALLFVYTGKRLARTEGIVMVCLYMGYMLFIIGGFSL
jgi:cation:H+ antiporter